VSKSIRSDTPTAEMGVALVAGQSKSSGDPECAFGPEYVKTLLQQVRKKLLGMVQSKRDAWLEKFNLWAHQGKLDDKMALVILEGIADIRESLALDGGSGTGPIRPDNVKTLNDKVKGSRFIRKNYLKEPMKVEGCHYKTTYHEEMLFFSNDMKFGLDNMYMAADSSSCLGVRTMVSKLSSIITRGITSIRKDILMLGCVEQ